MCPKKIVVLLLVFFLGCFTLFAPQKTNAQIINSYIYNDSLQNQWTENNVWDNVITPNFSNTSPVYSDNFSLRGTYDIGWSHLVLRDIDGFDTSPYGKLYITARQPANQSNSWYGVYFLNHPDLNNMSSTSSNGALLQNTQGNVHDEWVTYEIDLYNFNASHTTIYGIRLVAFNNDSGTPYTVYLDEIGFGGTPQPEPTTPPQGSVNLTVDPTQNVNPFREEMLGVAFANWEHSWGSSFPGDVNDLAKVIKAANIKLIRYAGGLWSNWVGWERLPQRTPYGNYFANPANYDPIYSSLVKTNIEYNFHYGQDEIDSLAQLSEESGAEIMIETNIHHDNPYMWADMIKYSKDRGYNFKYWELGNEFDLDNPPLVTPALYNTRLAAYVDILKNADPNVKIIGGVPASAHDAFRTNDWSQTGLSQYLYGTAQTQSPTGKKVDSLSYHWYQSCNIQNSPLQERINSMMKYSWDIDPNLINNSYSRIWSEIVPRRVENEIISPNIPGVSQGITELNMDACDFGTAPQNANQINAVWMSDVLGRLAYNGLDYVTWYTGYGNQGQGYPAIFALNNVNPSTVYLRPSYYTLFLWGNYFGDQMLATSTPNEQDISIWASTDSDDPGKVKLIVNNLSAGDYNANINLGNLTPSGGSKYSVTSTADLNYIFSSSGIGYNNTDHKTRINGYELTSANIAQAVNQIPAVAVNISGSTLTDTLPPYSVTAYVLNTGQGSTSTPTPTPSQPGDANADGLVNIQDFVILSNTFGSTTDLRADFDSNSVINIQDFVILSNNFGS